MREKLIELLESSLFPDYDFDRLADTLISNNVLLVLRCRDCKHYKAQKPYPSYNGEVKYCTHSANKKVSENDFCSFGERKDDEKI